MKNGLLTLALLLNPILSFGQQIVTTYGECRVDRGTTYEQAVEKALDHAKREAINTVCGLDVSTFSIVRTSDDTRSYNSKTTTNAYGVVRIHDKSVEYDNGYVRVEITGEVYKVFVPRAISVSGLKDVYDLNDNLAFSISFHKASYLKIFWFDEENGDGGILYNGYTCFDGSDYPVDFPVFRGDNYKKMICPTLMTSDDRLREWSISGVYKTISEDDRIDKHVTILFVTTKDSVPFTSNTVNEDTFMDWWCDLPVAEREMPERKTITIKMM